MVIFSFLLNLKNVFMKDKIKKYSFHNLINTDVIVSEVIICEC